MSGHGGTYLKINAGDTTYWTTVKRYSDDAETAFKAMARTQEAARVGCKANEVRLGSISRPSSEPEGTFIALG